MTWIDPDMGPGPSTPIDVPDRWFPQTVPRPQPPPYRVGLKIASSETRSKSDMDAKLKKKQIVRRMILGALMQSPLYFSVPLPERRLLFKRIWDSFNVK